MDVAGDLGGHLLEQIERVAQHPEDIDAFGPDMVFRRDQVLGLPGHAFAQASDLLLHVAAYGGVMLLANHQVQVTPRRLVHVVH